MHGKDFLFFLQVIFETLRLANIVNGVLRKTTTDVELNGTFLITWKIIEVQFNFFKFSVSIDI